MNTLLITHSQFDDRITAGAHVAINVKYNQSVNYNHSLWNVCNNVSIFTTNIDLLCKYELHSFNRFNIPMYSHEIQAFQNTNTVPAR